MFLFFVLKIDIEANSTAPDTEDAEWKGGGGRSSIHTPSSANMPLENTGKVKFDPPSVPVIFVLGTRTLYCVHAAIIHSIFCF